MWTVVDKSVPFDHIGRFSLRLSMSIRHHREMVTDFLHMIGPANSLQRRRLTHAVRRAMIAVAAGVAVFAALMCVVGAQATRTVMVAAVDITRGRTVDADMLRPAQVPVSDVGGWSWDAVLDNVTGLPGVAQVDITAGQPIFGSMIRAQPVVPDGFTVIEVRLASAAGVLTAGDEIALASAVGCARDETDEAGGTAADDACILVERALVMREPQDVTPDAATTLAMAPDDALRVMSSQEAGAIVAVAR